MPVILSVNDVASIMPDATTANINLYLSYLNQFMPKYSINNSRRVAAFLAQVDVETQGLYYATELSSGEQYNFRTDLGNDQAGDGPKYKGRGLLQLTGKKNYAAFSKYKYGDTSTLLSNPGQLASSPSLAAESACWFWGVNNGTVLNTAADNGDFNKVTKVVNGGYNGYTARTAAYQRANDTLNTGVNFVPDQTTTGAGGAQNIASNPASLNTDFQFQQIQSNVENAEAENSNVVWGSRMTSSEESDFIGLKQFLLYLTTRYYPQNMVPFIEMIPVYSIDSPMKITSSGGSNVPINNVVNGDAASMDKLQSVEGDQTNSNYVQSRTFLDADRFNRTAAQLTDLSNRGGADLFTIDPFLETSTAFNTPNDIGQDIQDRRGFGYKIFGTLTLNPSLQGKSLSKAGNVGLRSFEVEAGSQSQNAMSLVQIKLLDVQGNKFLDINSPWSFILNSRAGMVGADFYFRFGHQIRIPDPNRKDDDQAQRFWSHPGWQLFQSLNSKGNDKGDDAKTIKQYIQNIASTCDWTITLTQSSTLSSMRTPGYMLDQTTGNFIISRNLNFDDYMTLVLINPELNVNPHDGSIEATLFFKSNGAVANCLVPLNGAGLDPKNFQTKALALQSRFTLTKLMKAFVSDNKSYINGNSILKGIADRAKNSVFLSDFDIKEWLTVVGGAGTDSLVDVDPDSIRIVLSNDLQQDIKRAESKDNRLLISWLREVLEANNLALLNAGDKQSAVSSTVSSLNGGFVIAYDSENVKEQENRKVTGKDLASSDASFGDYLNYTNQDQSNQNFIGNRLLVQDDVMSFRFQGSLVEDISVEKNEVPNQTTIQAQKQFAEGLVGNESKGDVESNTLDANGNNTGGTTGTNVTYQSKKIALNILYSTMLGLKATCIAHPWLKLCRPIYVKGMGFWDGKYMVTKLKHSLSEDNRFITEINGCRVWPAGSDKKTASDQNAASESAMNNPSKKKATPISVPKYQSKDKTFTALPNLNVTAGGIKYNVTNDANAAQSIQTFPTAVPLRDSLENFIQFLHYTQQDKFRSFVKAVESKTDYLVTITSGYRTWSEQAAEFASDNRNASPGRSMHNYGLAIDLNLNHKTNGSSIVKATPVSTWIASGVTSVANSYGLTWGGTFNNYNDNVHFGFDRTYDIGVLYAQAIQQFGNDVTAINGNFVKITG